MTKQKNIYRKGALDFLRAAVLPVLFTGTIIIMIISGLKQTAASGSAEGLRILDESIRRAVVTCYAIEGRYPPGIEYIEQNYGIHIDKSRYTVHYTIFASNIMPDVRVIEVD